VRDYLLFLRNHANRHNRDHQITRQRGKGLSGELCRAGCEKGSPLCCPSGLRSRSAR
jgi:prepilin peptidase dependent protein A